MNEDILKGKWLEIKGRVKEKWGKLKDNDLRAIAGQGEKLLGLLQKKYGQIKDKDELKYKDSAELLEIVSSLREIIAKKENIMAIAFIANCFLFFVNALSPGFIFSLLAGIACPCGTPSSA